MDGGCHRVRLAGDDGVGGELVNVTLVPDIVKAGEEERLLACQADQVGLLACRGDLPLIEAIAGHHAAASFHQGCEQLAGGNSLCPGIDGAHAVLGVLRPAWHEAPHERLQPGLAVLTARNPGSLRGRDVVVGRNLRRTALSV